MTHLVSALVSNGVFFSNIRFIALYSLGSFIAVKFDFLYDVFRQDIKIRDGG